MTAVTAQPRCQNCQAELLDEDADHAWCLACRSPKGKVAELFIGLRTDAAPSDGHGRWGEFLHLLEGRFGERLSREERSTHLTTRRALAAQLENAQRADLRGEVPDHLLGEAVYSRTLEQVMAWLRDAAARATPSAGELPVAEVARESEVGASGQQHSDDTPSDTPLKPAARRAWASWILAESKFAKRPRDREAYDWLIEADDELLVGELAAYRDHPPAFGTWQRHLRTARKHHGKQKNSPRARRTGRSVVQHSEL